MRGNGRRTQVWPRVRPCCCACRVYAVMCSTQPRGITTQAICSLPERECLEKRKISRSHLKMRNDRVARLSFVVAECPGFEADGCAIPV